MSARLKLAMLSLCVLLNAGCYAPLLKQGILANTLDDSYRYPSRANTQAINYATLTRDVPSNYILGEPDLVEVEIADLPITNDFRNNNNQRVTRPPSSQVLETTLSSEGEILLPLVGNVQISGLSITQAQEKIASAYEDGYLDEARVAVRLKEKRKVRVMVLGAVSQPGVYELPMYENDIAHAVTNAGGVVQEEADEIQVHRKLSKESEENLRDGEGEVQPHLNVMKIPLRSSSLECISPEDAILNEGDVVIVRANPDEVFFVTGKLSQSNLVRFTLGRENRDLGNGFVLPKDRDVDVITAVAMAGYIDPIDSPTTVTVHRTLADGRPMLIHVDLILARSQQCENIMIRPGDIIYLNPDAAWWFRRTLDRIIPDLLIFPYERALIKAFGQNQR